jgi:thiol-disulfide isomerase/thioredoxin
MKRFSLILIALFGIFSMQAQENKYEIGIKIKGLKQGDELLLANYFGEQTMRKDTCYVDESGYGYFTGTERLNRGMYLVATGDLKVFEILVDDDQFFTISTDSAENKWYHNMTVKGSEANELFRTYWLYMGEKSSEIRKIQVKINGTKDSVKIKEYNEERIKLGQSINDYKMDLINNQPEQLLAKFFNGHRDVDIPKDMPDSLIRDFYKAHYWDNFDFSEEGLVRAPQNLIKKKIDYYIDNLTFPDPDSLKEACDFLIEKASGDKELDRYFIWYLGRKFQESNFMCMDDVYVHIARKYYCTGRAWWVDSALIEKICEEANKASYVQCNGAAPNMLNLDSADVPKELYKEAGTYTFIFFWDPTCGHCKKVIPLLDSIYKANKHKGWVVYAIASQNKYVEWREYLRAHPEIHDWVNVCKTSNYAPWPYKRLEYNNISNPTIYIMDQDKKIIAKKIQEHNIAEFMEHIEKGKQLKLESGG